MGFFKRAAGHRPFDVQGPPSFVVSAAQTCAAQMPMNVEEWKEKTISQMKAVGTYQDAFLPEVDAASLILAARDRAYEDFIADGGRATVEHTLDRGAVNIKRNPALDAWMNLDKQALDHWRNLGLTVDSLKKINDSTMTTKKVSSLSDALSQLTDDTKRKKTLERNTKVRKGNTKRKEGSVRRTKAGNRKILPGPGEPAV